MGAGSKMAIIVLLGGLFSACALLPSRPLNVMGTVAGRERSALPSEVLVEVTLFDVTQGDAVAQVVATQSISLNGRQLPVAFDLVVQPGWRKAKGRYVLRAQIVRPDGSVLYASDKDYPVTLGKQPPELEIVVKPVKTGTQS